MTGEPHPPAGDAIALEARMRELEATRIRALLAADLPELRRLHAADYQLITPSGRTFTRERYLGLIEAGELRYVRWEPGAIDVRASERMAIVRYRVTLQLASAAGEGVPQPCWHTDSYEPIDGRWQAVWSQATAIWPD